MADGAAAGGGGAKSGKARKERGERKIRDLRDELEKLREKVEREREKATKTSGDAPMAISGAEAQFKVSGRPSLDGENELQLHSEDIHAHLLPPPAAARTCRP